MSLWKTLAAAVGGGIAVGLGVQMGRSHPVSPRLDALEKRVADLEQPRTDQNFRIETIIKAVAQLAEHSGEMEKRIRKIDEKLEAPPVEQVLEERLAERLNFLEATIQSHSKSLDDLVHRAAAGERAWTELVTRMEQLCRTLASETEEHEGVVVLKPRGDQKWRWRS